LTRFAAGYQPQTGAGRASALCIIIGIHGVALAALLSLGGAQLVMREAQPLLVRFLPAPPSAPVDIPRAVPLPKLRAPDIKLAPPPIENLITVRMEESAPPAPPVVSATISPAAPPLPARSPPPAPSPSVAEPPRADMAYLNNPPPAYPAVSKRAGEHGRVVLRVRVDADGRVEAIEVQSTSGYPRLDEAALAAVRRWKFVPAKLGERAVAGWAIVPVNFTLRG
jgi:protein TonB